MKLVFDIETVGFDFESLSESQQEYLLRYAEKENDETVRQQKIDDSIRYLSLYPFTAKVVAIAMLNVKSGQTMVLYEGEEKEETLSTEKPVIYKPLTEKEMLETFWEYATKVDQFITFNGRQFDVPFLMLRSAMLRVKPAINLLGNRFDSSKHLDLLEMLTFYSLFRKFNLDFYCKAFGIESPKSKGVSGMDVKQLYEAGRIKEIAVYCGDDVRATYELYKIWDEFLNI